MVKQKEQFCDPKTFNKLLKDLIIVNFSETEFYTKSLLHLDSKKANKGASSIWQYRTCAGDPGLITV